jgi:hypothetical protein
LPLPAALLVETVDDDDSVCTEPPALIPKTSHDSDDDSDDDDDDDNSPIDLLDFDGAFGINAIGVNITNIPTTDEVLLDDTLADDPALDVHDADICHPMTCRCCKIPSTNLSPIDQFLFDAAVPSPDEIDQDKILHHLSHDDGTTHEYLINEIRHHDYDGPRAHLDDGAQTTTTHKLEHLFAYRPFSDKTPCRTRLVSADGHRYVPLGYGILRIPAPNPQGYLPAFCFYTPEITSCIISPSTIERLIPKNRQEGTTLRKYPTTGVFTFTVHSNLRASDNIELNGILDAGLCYTHPILLPPQPTDTPVTTQPTSSDSISPPVPLDSEYNLHKLSVRADRLLWHQRLGHCSDHYLYHAHKHIIGVPQFKHHDPVLDQCPTCLAAKLKKRAPGHKSTMKATSPAQGLSIDFAFTGQASKDSARSAFYKGFNGEMSFIVIKDHFTDELDGTVRISKGAPVNWLRQWLTEHSPDIPGKYVHMDQGGELYNNPKIRSLFKEFGYDIYPTGADASHQNGPVERAHQTIGDALRALLTGANLDPRFWPYAFYYFLRIKNALPGKDDTPSSFEQLHAGLKADLTDLRTFGCRVWVRPPWQTPQSFEEPCQAWYFSRFSPSHYEKYPLVRS